MQHEGFGIDYLVSGGLGHMINSVRNTIFSALETELAPLELTSAQFVVVIAAMRGRASTVNEFCSFAGVEAGPMSRLLDRLEAKGIVSRVRGDVDRRQVQVLLTEKGRQLSPQIMPVITKVYTQFLSDFSSEEAALLQSLLQRLLDNAVN